jgi:RHS repeat-associated protein
MAYDNLDRLTQTTSPSTVFSTATYSYDVLDNLTTVNISGGSQARNHSYVYDATTRRLSQVKNTVGGAIIANLTYDVQGNLASKGPAGSPQSYSFDLGNRLRSVPNLETGYEYDGHGRRVFANTVGSGSILSQYANSGQVLYQEDNKQSKRLDYVYLGNRLIAYRERPLSSGTVTVKYQHTDALGSPIAVTNSAKTLIESSEYEPFGQLVNKPLFDGPGYTGHVQDAATGLTYMQQRYYDPQIGRFLSVDPVTALNDPVALFNRYMYAGNNPINAVDPDGRRCVVANISSVYCLRRDIYRQFDRNAAGSTRFFGAAALTVEYLANTDIPFLGTLGGSAEARQFLHGVSKELYAMNARTYSKVLEGSLSGQGLDSDLVRMEQTAVQGKLDALQEDKRDRIISSINASFGRRLLGGGHARDAQYNKVLDRVEKSLGRSVNFGNQSDREAIGNALIEYLRTNGGCTPTGSNIRSC